MAGVADAVIAASATKQKKTHTHQTLKNKAQQRCCTSHVMPRHARWTGCGRSTGTFDGSALKGVKCYTNYVNINAAQRTFKICAH